MTNVAMRLTTLLVCYAMLGACGGGTSTEDPIEPPELRADQLFGDPAPPSAVPMPAREFATLVAAGKLHLVTVEEITLQEERAVEQMAIDRTRAEGLFAGRMDILERHTAEPGPDQSDYEKLPDGSLRVLIRAADPRTGQTERHVVLQGRRQAYAELADTLERYRTRQNHRGLYGNLHAHLDASIIDRLDLPEPSATAAWSFEELEALNLKVAQAWSTIEPLPPAPPPGYPTGAASEEGHGVFDGAEYPTHTGMWDQIDFPLKWYATSVKDQGNRGTCVAFAVTAAVETIVARDEGRWVNLSEQMLYNRAKQIWWPSTYGDNLNTDGTLARMLMALYRYSWESSWEYNRSPVRKKLGITYLDSDLGSASEGIPKYEGKHCSDSNHQATLFTTTTNLGDFCAFVDPADDVPPDAGFGFGGCQALGEPGLVNLAFAKVSLMLRIPVMISVTVPDAMRVGNVDSTGIVSSVFVPLAHGGHAMLLVGYIENADLPPGTPAGGGGGYFVCKNSWGPEYGDGGYCYLSDAWVLTWARGLWAVDTIFEL